MACSTRSIGTSGNKIEQVALIQRVASVAAAFLLAALAPALVMAALWHAAKIASAVFAFTFAIALYHAFFFGLPLFLVFRSKGWINVMSCVVSGFAVGALPAGVLTWPMQHPIVNGVVTAAGWVNYVKPLIYFGSFGALGGFVFWVALISAGTVRKVAAVHRWADHDLLGERGRESQLQFSPKSRRSNQETGHGAYPKRGAADAPQSRHMGDDRAFLEKRGPKITPLSGRVA
jgi:hypothetical protein